MASRHDLAAHMRSTRRRVLDNSGELVWTVTRLHDEISRFQAEGHRGTDNCKVVALSWDQETTMPGRAVRITWTSRGDHWDGGRRVHSDLGIAWRMAFASITQLFHAGSTSCGS